MPTPLQTILDAYPVPARTQKEKGTYLRYEASYADLYSEIWLCADWAKEIGGPQFGLIAKDIGIDRVAKTHGTGEYHAIQCKCYAVSSDAEVGKKRAANENIVETFARELR